MNCWKNGIDPKIKKRRGPGRSQANGLDQSRAGEKVWRVKSPPSTYVLTP